MKKLRLVSLLLVLVILLGSFSSCSLLDFAEQKPLQTTEAPTTPTGGNVPLPPSGGASQNELAYTLTQKDIDEMYVLLDACEALFVGEAKETEELERMLEDMEGAYYHILTQAQLANIYYYADQTNATLTEQYQFAFDASNDVFAAYAEMCRAVDQSDSPNRAFFFAEWTEADMEEMRSFSSEETDFSKANNDLLVELHALSEQDYYDESAKLYLQFIRNNHALAVIKGYNDYWRYASVEVYDRTYTAFEMQEMREYVKTRLLPLLQEVATEFSLAYSELSLAQKQKLELFLSADYDKHSGNMINGYITTYASDVQAVVKDLLTAENSLITDSPNAYAGAFTTYLYELERPFCYFGPGVQNVFTVAHEMGHYYSAAVKGDLDIDLDLAEVHSQSNEWLFFAYLESTQSDAALMNALRLYRLYEALDVVIRCVIIDEFEQKCYQQAGSITSADQFDGIMQDVLRSYGVGEAFDVLYDYWRYVVMDSPVYYLSYAVSMLAALQVYAKADTVSYQAGQAAYLQLVEGAAQGDTFLQALADAELYSPTQLSTYVAIVGLVQRN